MHKQCLLPFWHSGYQREIVMQSTNHLQHESNTMFQTPQSARQNRQLDCWGTSCLYQTVIWFSRKTNKVLHRAMNPLNTVELWCGGQTCKNVQLASQLMQFYRATASKAVTETDKQQSYCECPPVFGTQVTTAAYDSCLEATSRLHWSSSSKASQFLTVS